MDFQEVHEHLSNAHYKRNGMGESRVDKYIFRAITDTHPNLNVRQGEIEIKSDEVRWKADIMVDDYIAIECKGGNITSHRSGIAQALGFRAYGYIPVFAAFNISNSISSMLYDLPLHVYNLLPSGKVEYIDPNCNICSSINQLQQRVLELEDTLYARESDLESVNSKIDSKKQMLDDIMDGRVTHLELVSNEKEREILEMAARYKIIKHDMPSWLIDDYDPDTILAPGTLIK